MGQPEHFCKQVFFLYFRPLLCDFDKYGQATDAVPSISLIISVQICAVHAVVQMAYDFATKLD